VGQQSNDRQVHYSLIAMGQVMAKPWHSDCKLYNLRSTIHKVCKPEARIIFWKKWCHCWVSAAEQKCLCVPR
jgi:hypothetical protein